MSAKRPAVGGRRCAALLALSVLLGAPGVGAQTVTPTAHPGRSVATRSGHVPANGIRYYYEIHGKGEPLLVLHGGLGSIDMFGPVLSALASGRQVIAVDLHGHGRTELGERPIRLPDIGNDLAVILKALGYGTVDVMGYSFGAGAAFRLAVQHPQVVRRLVLVSSGFARDGFYPECCDAGARAQRWPASERRRDIPTSGSRPAGRFSEAARSVGNGRAPSTGQTT